MQLSAANLLIASQQLARGGQKPSPATAEFAQALAKEKGVEGAAAFEPIAFKAAPAAPQPAAAPAAPAAPAAGYAGGRTLGANLDIRV